MRLQGRGYGVDTGGLADGADLIESNGLKLCAPGPKGRTWGTGNCGGWKGYRADAFAARSIKRATSFGLEIYTAWLADEADVPDRLGVRRSDGRRQKRDRCGRRGNEFPGHRTLLRPTPSIAQRQFHEYQIRLKFLWILEVGRTVPESKLAVHVDGLGQQVPGVEPHQLKAVRSRGVD